MNAKEEGHLCSWERANWRGDRVRVAVDGQTDDEARRDSRLSFFPSFHSPVLAKRFVHSNGDTSTPRLVQESAHVDRRVCQEPRKGAPGCAREKQVRGESGHTSARSAPVPGRPGALYSGRHSDSATMSGSDRATGTAEAERARDFSRPHESSPDSSRNVPETLPSVHTGVPEAAQRPRA